MASEHTNPTQDLIVWNHNDYNAFTGNNVFTKLIPALSMLLSPALDFAMNNKILIVSAVFQSSPWLDLLCFVLGFGIEGVRAGEFYRYLKDLSSYS